MSRRTVHRRLPAHRRLIAEAGFCLNTLARIRQFPKLLSTHYDTLRPHVRGALCKSLSYVSRILLKGAEAGDLDASADFILMPRRSHPDCLAAGGVPPNTSLAIGAIPTSYGSCAGAGGVSVVHQSHLA